MRTCAFCQQTAKMSGEHIWSNWASKIFGPKGFNFRQKDGSGAVVRRWQQRTIDFKAHVVCESCNNGWMSELENNEAKPALKDMIEHGHKVSLFPRRIAAISVFAFKCAVVADHMRPNGKLFFKPSTRESFMRLRRLPEGFQVWLAELRGDFAMQGVINSVYLHNPHPLLKDFEFYVMTYILGHLVIQTVCPRWIKPTRRRLPLPVLRQASSSNARSVLIFPNDGLPVSWPPPNHLGSHDIEAFCYRLKNLNLPA